MVCVRGAQSRVDEPLGLRERRQTTRGALEPTFQAYQVRPVGRGPGALVNRSTLVGHTSARDRVVSEPVLSLGVYPPVLCGVILLLGFWVVTKSSLASLGEGTRVFAQNRTDLDSQNTCSAPRLFYFKPD